MKREMRKEAKRERERESERERETRKRRKGKKKTEKDGTRGRQNKTKRRKTKHERRKLEFGFHLGPFWDSFGLQEGPKGSTWAPKATRKSPPRLSWGIIWAPRGS